MLPTSCGFIMDSPDPDFPPENPNQPGASAQVVFLPQGMEVRDLAVYGNYLYATVPTKDQVYRFNISDLANLSLTASAVPYVQVPGAGGITADDRGGLYIGSTGTPKPGVAEHKWTNDQVIYFTHTSESWHSRFKNDPAQKLFVAPRGSFDALSFYKDPLAATNKRYEGGLYYAGGYNLEGMTINKDRYTNSLNAITNLIPPELDFLIQLALGGISFNDLDLDKIFSVADILHVDVDLSGALNADNSINYVNLAVNNLSKFVGIGGDLNYLYNARLRFDPKWGLNLVTLWGLPLELPYSMISDEVMGFLTGSGVTGNEIADLLLGILANVYIAQLVGDYIVSGSGMETLLSLNGFYKDQPGERPERPYVVIDPVDPNYQYPMSLNFDREVANASNVKIALTLSLLQFKDGPGGQPFSLIEGRGQFKAFLDALEISDMVEMVKEIVKVLDLQRLITYNVIDNQQVNAYIQFLINVAEKSDIDLVATLEDFATLLAGFGVQIDFRRLLEEWWNLPDWEDIPGTRAGLIIDHNMLGAIYQALDGFTENLTGTWETLAGWVTSKIPRVNSAQGWAYASPSKPTGIAFGRDAGAGGIVGWVVDGGKLYSRRIDVAPYSPPYVERRDDYPYSAQHPAPVSPWQWDPINREWWVTIAASGQSPTSVPRTTALDYCHGVIYDQANKRVLVSCSDAQGTPGKGRVVAVQYNTLSPATPVTFTFTPPPPRLPLNRSAQQINAGFSVKQLTPPDGVLSNPKGMALKDNHLFIADGNRIVVYYIGP